LHLFIQSFQFAGVCAASFINITCNLSTDPRIAAGSQQEMLRQIKAYPDGQPSDEILLIFEDQTGTQVDFDLRGSIEEVLERAAPKPVRSGPGRPRLGVISREISLLPRHREWLEAQRSGASATLRRLVDEARKQDSPESGNQRAIEATGRVTTAIGGNLPGFEEAYRALYARDHRRLEGWVKDWPPDLREYVLA
jgi:uncharacterized protein